MLYLSQLLGAAVEDMQGTRVGKIIDIIISVNSQPASLPILLVEDETHQSYYIPVGDTLVVAHPSASRGNILRLRVQQAGRDKSVGATLEVARPPAGEPSQHISLAREVLDKQVIDLQHKKAARVNDVCFNDDWRILGIDNSALGLLRRLAPSWLVGTRFVTSTHVKLIPWEHIELIGESTPPSEPSPPPVGATLEVARPPAGEPSPAPSDAKTARSQSGQLAGLRPADIADIVYQLTPGQGARLLEGLDDQVAAGALEELDTDRQSHILENISAERAADILEEMEPDEAADLLARLPEERAQELLRLMTPQESEDVQELLEYEEESAGGIMTTDFVAIDATKTAGEALEAVRSNIREQDVRLAYVYCIADEAREDYTLLGIVSLWELLIADPAQPLQELMKTDLVTVQPDAEPRAVAEIMAKYNFLAVPVVSKAGTLEGVVTIDDILDLLLPGEQRRKSRRMY